MLRLVEFAFGRLEGEARGVEADARGLALAEGEDHLCEHRHHTSVEPVELFAILALHGVGVVVVTLLARLVDALLEWRDALACLAERGEAAQDLLVARIRVRHHLIRAVNLALELVALVLQVAKCSDGALVLACLLPLELRVAGGAEEPLRLLGRARRRDERPLPMPRS